MTPPETFSRIPPARLRRLRDRYGFCVSNPTEAGCPPGDYVATVLAELGAALAGRGGAR